MGNDQPLLFTPGPSLQSSQQFLTDISTNPLLLHDITFVARQTWVLRMRKHSSISNPLNYLKDSFLRFPNNSKINFLSHNTN